MKTYEWLPKFPFVGGLGGFWIYKDLGEYRYRFIYRKNLGGTPPINSTKKELGMSQFGFGGKVQNFGSGRSAGAKRASEKSKNKKNEVTRRRKRKVARAALEVQAKELLKKY